MSDRNDSSRSFSVLFLEICGSMQQEQNVLKEKETKMFIQI